MICLTNSLTNSRTKSLPKSSAIKNNGIALIQVLLITATLSVLAIYLTNTAKEQVTIAHWSNDKAQAVVNLHSAESELIFALLTKSLTSSNLNDDLDSNANNFNDFDEETNDTDTNVNYIAKQWNFFNKPFEVNNLVTAKIQDQAGLIHAHYPIHRILKLFIGAQGYNETDVNKIVDSLLDWQDLDSIPRLNGEEHVSFSGGIRNGAISNLHDIEFIPAIPLPLHKTLINNLTIYRRGNLNPMNASLALISALSNKETAQQIGQLRDDKQLTIKSFIELTGIKEQDDIYYQPSNYFALTLKSKVGEAVVNKEFIIKLLPTASNIHSPINIYSNRG